MPVASPAQPTASNSRSPPPPQQSPRGRRRRTHLPAGSSTPAPLQETAPQPSPAMPYASPAAYSPLRVSIQRRARFPAGSRIPARSPATPMPFTSPASGLSRATSSTASAAKSSPMVATASLSITPLTPTTTSGLRTFPAASPTPAASRRAPTVSTSTVSALSRAASSTAAPLPPIAVRAST